MVSSLLIGKYSYFHDEIQVILEEKEEKDGLEKELEKYTRRYNFSDLKDIQKVTAALMRKGFRYEDIKKGIKEIVNGES